MSKGAITTHEPRLADAGSRVIGTKQTVRALERGCVSAVYIASDAEAYYSGCQSALWENGVPLSIDTMEELGKVCELMWVQLPPYT